MADLPVTPPPLFTALAGALDAIVFVTDPQSRMLWANDQLRARTGFTVEDFQFPQPDNPFIHPADLPRVVRHLEEFAASPAQVSSPVENRFHDRWGGLKRYRSVIAKVAWDGQPALLFVTAETAQSSAHAQVDAEARYRALVESATDAILRADEYGRIAFANAETYRMLGYSVVELGKMRLLDLFDPAEREFAAEQLREHPGMPRSARFHARLRTQSGGAVEADISTTRVDTPDEHGGIQAIIRDVTVQHQMEVERRGMEARVQQAAQLESLGLLAAGIAHDFNNLLTVIMTSTSEARRKLATGAPAESALDNLDRAARKAAALCQQMMAYAAHRGPTTRWVDVGELVHETVDVLRPTLARGTRVAVTVAPGDVGALGDETQLRQVVMNLLTNAADALPDGSGSVELAVTTEHVDAARLREFLLGEDLPSGEYVHLLVRDDGTGMSASDRARMFDPFFTTKARGRGIGLAGVLRILRAHHGAVAVDSAPGRGTSMHVWLPLVPAPATVPSAPPPDALPWRGSGTVLVADDEATLRGLSRLALQQAGFTVLEAQDGLQAIELFRAHRAEIVLAILDASMPRVDGRAAALSLHAMNAQLPILLSAGAQDARTFGGVDDGTVTAHLPRPYSAEVLLEAVRSALNPPASA